MSEDLSQWAKNALAKNEKKQRSGGQSNIFFYVIIAIVVIMIILVIWMVMRTPSKTATPQVTVPTPDQLINNKNYVPVPAIPSTR